jgi:thiol-disulfide isomerase/thioredoxin
MSQRETPTTAPRRRNISYMNTRSAAWLAIAVALIAALVGFIAYGIWSDAPTAPVVSAPQPVTPDVAPDDAASPEAPAAAQPVPTVLPDVTLVDRGGKPTSIRSFQGRPLLVNFWATWCAPCRREIPLLNALRRERAAQGFEVVGIAVDFREDVLKYVEKTAVDYPLLIGEEDGLAAAQAFGIDLAFPVSVFADRNGRIIAAKVGELHRNEAEFILDQIAEVDAGNLEIVTAKAAIAEKLQQFALERAQPAVEPAT